MSRVSICCLLAAQSLLWFGCHKKAPEKSGQMPSVPVASRPAAAPEATEAPAPPPPASPVVENSAAPAPEAADPDVVLTVANAVQSYTIAHPEGPKSLDDLVKAGYLHSLPTPPAGKKFALNPKNFEVTLVNQ